VNGGRKRENGNGSEDTVWKALQSQLQPGETLLRNVRFTDAKYGDVEVDFLVLMPDAGIAVIEVKGGIVAFEDGQWTSRSLTNPNWSRRINPIDQSRKAKHAVRRYLDRQPEWQHGLVRSAWFVAMPFTDVTGDMSTDGKREHLLGKSDVESLRDRIRDVLLDPLNSDQLPTDEWSDDALSLILRLEHSNGDVPVTTEPTSEPHFSTSEKVLITLGSLIAVMAGIILTALLTVRGGWLPAVILAVTFAAIMALMWKRMEVTSLRRALRNSVGVAGLLGIVIGFTGVLALFGQQVTEGECDPNYLPCIPIAEKLNCPDIKIAVRVIGTDIHNLDRDGNGTGCESYR
jgi:hypothetical protein